MEKSVCSLFGAFVGHARAMQGPRTGPVPCWRGLQPAVNQGLGQYLLW